MRGKGQQALTLTQPHQTQRNAGPDAHIGPTCSVEHGLVESLQQ